jgi:LPS-assembly protein
MANPDFQRDSFLLSLRHGVAWGCLTLLLTSGFSGVALAKDKPETSLVQADEMDYDQKTNIVTATGHVEIARGKQLLQADRVVYDQNRDVVHAEGHVVMLQPSGDVMFAEKVELTGDMADGFVQRVGILFSDKSRMTAENAQRYEGRYLVGEHGLYTACNLCADNPRDPPLWQMVAARVTDDSDKQDVIYRDVTVELAGIPVFYSPYFSHPEPSVKRRQGFLMPSAGSSSNVGAFARTPYYFDLAPESDLTVTPTFSEKDMAQVALDWRQRFAHGQMKWSTSFANADYIDDSGVDKGTSFRGGLFGDLLFDLNNKWRAGGQVALTTDKTYFSRYNISHEDVLVNRGYLEHFSGRDYAVVNNYYFQDLRPGDQLTEPVVAPQVTYSHYGEPGKAFGGRWSFGSDMLVVSRSRDTALALQGPDTRRLSSNVGWDRQMISSTGLVTDVSALMRTDAYWSDNMERDGNVNDRYGDVVRARPFAQSDVIFRYPLGRRGDGYQQLIEPIAQFSVAPNVSSNSLIPNEDSQDVEFDETNLFTKNRFSGMDRIEGGSRATYGLRHSLTTDSGGRIEALFGQIYRLKENNAFSNDSGLREKASDYVGRIDFVPNKYADLNYGFMYNKDDFTPEKHEVRGSVGIPEFRPFVNYLSVNQTLINDVVTPLEEITAGFSSTFAKYYTITFSHEQAFQPDPGARLSSIQALYHDECLQLGVTVQRNETVRTGLSSGTSFLFNFYLRNIGGIETDSTSSVSYDKTLMNSVNNSSKFTY